MDEKYIGQFKKGSLEMILLCLISKEETYGYKLITELNLKGAKVLGYAKEGTIYPILYRLENSGLIKCRVVPSTVNRGSRKYYSVTESGRMVLTEMREFWSKYVTVVNSFIDDKCLAEEAV